MKQRTRIIWVPYGYRLKPRAKLKKAVIRQRVPAATIKKSSRHSHGHQQHQAHNEQKIDETVSVKLGDTANIGPNENSSVGQPSTTKNQTDRSSEVSVTTDNSYLAKGDCATRNSTVKKEEKTVVDAQMEYDEKSQVATFDDAFNPYKNYLQDMSNSLAGMPDEVFTRNEYQQESFTGQTTISIAPDEINTHTPELVHPVRVDPETVNLDTCSASQQSCGMPPNTSIAPDAERKSERQETTFSSAPPAAKNEAIKKSETLEDKRKHVGPHLRKLSGIAPSLMSENYP
ncbi:hypothetical protein [Vibrio penaeicida]|uniref:Uncharacterized protein n=1 Tax=Vibrio penaeicida TaxID=104609 RepID=A0AAV5NTA9_9VIBR|nr:hypothetical protein [Vibrio penaeicida]RTZ24369.1 hypothetical protein EKN09_04010 [Vibrio penaeicida]GLQ73463.1 hypothetical protein GCM10007932_28230 [Vibrio penaeicida]